MRAHALLVLASVAISRTHPVQDGPCALEDGMDYTGNDLGVGKATTVADCCTECAATPGCTAFTVWLGGPQCYLKKNATGRRASPGHTSGNVTNPIPPPPDPTEFKNATDCLMRSVFVAYAAAVNPNVDEEKAQAMIDALAGDPIMGQGCNIDLPPQLSLPRQHRSLDSASRRMTSSGTNGGFGNGGGTQVWADATNGDDTAAGTRAAPFKTIERALAAVRSAGQGGTVTLRAGTFRPADTLVLTPADSGVTIETDPEDAPALAWLSGSTPLAGAGLQWKPVNTTGGANVWAVDLSHTNVTSVSGLRSAGRRLWSARYPNGDPETTFPFNAKLSATQWLASPNDNFPPVTSLNAPTWTNRNDTLTDTAYTMTVGGSACAKYTPPISRYCRNTNDAGGGAVVADTTLPHAPYADPTGAIISALHGGAWCSFSYRVGAATHSDGATTFRFSEGGQQCNRPEGSHGAILIEGVLEELDQPNEFHFNTSTRLLTLWYNATSGTPPPIDGSLEVVTLRTLINVTGSQASPVRNLRLSRLGFRDTASTLFSPHVAPTGGDWAVNRAAAVTAAGTLGLTVEHATFWRLDNAGVFLGGYHRGVAVTDNEFGWLGESAVVSVGDTTGAGFEDYPGFGWDGSAGDQPRGGLVARNFAHELGIFNKQSAFYFQAATDNTTVEANVMFNGARSGINFNDCFGTGSRVARNILFNLNRETADHGCFNSWDRLPFSIAKGPATRDVLSQNLALSNFNSYNGLDTDDDSAYFHMLDNVLLYGHVLKSDYSGHDIEYEGDFGVLTGPSNQYQPVPTDHINSLHDCVLLAAADGDSLFSLTAPNTCNTTSPTDFPRIYNVDIYTPAGMVTVCKQPVAALEAQGRIRNVTVGTFASWTPQRVVATARAKLGLPVTGKEVRRQLTRA